MAGFWSIVKPQLDTNYITNPSFEVNTTGWSVISTGVLTRDDGSGNVSRGLWAGKFTPSANATDGIYQAVTPVVEPFTIDFSVDVKGLNGVPYRVAILNGANGVLTSITFTGDGTWHRYHISYYSLVSVTVRCAVQKDNSASVAPIYIDGALAVITNSAAIHDCVYFDGDYEDGYWNGTPHNSTSSILKASRKTGGRIYTFDELGVFVRSSPGIGVPPGRHLTQEKVRGEGEEYEGRQILPRTTQLHCDIGGSTREDLHSKRSAFWGILKPDAAYSDEAVRVIYSGSDLDKPVYFWATYDNGMEFQGESGFTETTTLKLIGYDPNWYGEFDNITKLTTQNAVASVAYFAVRRNQVWMNGSGGTNGVVNGLAYRKTGHYPSGMKVRPPEPDTIYVGGAFTTAGGVTSNRVAKYYPQTDTWGTIGAGPGLNGTVNCVAVGPDGKVYFGGDFTDVAGGVGGTYNRIIYWDGSWHAMGTGCNDTVYWIGIGQDGTVYVGGKFTTANGVTVNRICYWNGTTFVAMGVTGVSGIVWDGKIAQNGDVYIGGAFVTAAGTTVNGVARWNGSAWSALSTGVAGGTATVIAVKIDEDGRIYMGGNFTSAGGNACSNIAMWNGSVFSALGSGVNNSVYTLEKYQNILLVGGVFTVAGGLTVTSIAGWNGSTWIHLDIQLPAGTVATVLSDGRQNIYLGYTASGTMYAGVSNTVENKGTKEVCPVLYIKRSGGTSAAAKWMENLSTGMRIYLNYSLLDGETLIIDVKNRMIYSDFFGNVTRAVLRNSDFADFRVLPGFNSLYIFVYQMGSPTMTQLVKWEELFWSADR